MKVEDRLIEDLENLIDVVEIIKQEGSLAFIVNSISLVDGVPIERKLTGYDLLTEYYASIADKVGTVLSNNGCV